MTVINLSEEIIEIERVLFQIKEEFEGIFNNIISIERKDKFEANNFERVRFYDYYPFLFAEEFKKVKKEKLKTLAVSGALYLKYLILNDHLMDSEKQINPLKLLYSDFLYKRSLNLLHSIFNTSSIFWKYFAEYDREFNTAILLERNKHFGIISPYSYSEFELIAKGKSAMAKYVTTALAILNGTPGKIEALEKSQDYFHTAFQLIDDMEDWKDDYLNRNYSYLLTNIIYDNHLDDECVSDNPPKLETIGRFLYLSKAAKNQMDKAIASLKKAATSGMNCIHWQNVIKEYESKSEGMRSKCIALHKKVVSRREIQQVKPESTQLTLGNSLGKPPLQFSIKRALDYILTDRELNLLAVQQYKIDKKNNNLTGNIVEKINHNYVVFLNALIIDTLIDARNYYPDADEVIKNEVKTLVSYKLKDVKGGWRYFPEIKELPPDADDLGQVLQILSRAKYDRISELISDDISLLLSQCSYNDGSLETWIIDKCDTSTEAILIKNARGNVWDYRMGKDNEVIANILYGLYLYDFIKLKKRIDEGIACLEKRQSKDGYWICSWYWGNYYGTYVSIRIIKSIKPNSITLKKAEKYLVNSQNNDGGWGNIGSDPLNTSLSLLSLVLLKSGNYACINRGVNFLYFSQNIKGYWDKVEFVKAFTHDSTHKSKIITTQYCLKALVAISKEKYLKNKTIISKQPTILIPQTKVHALYKDYIKYLSNKNNDGLEGCNSLGMLYVNKNKNFFNALNETLKIETNNITNKIIKYSKEVTLSIIKQIEQKNIIKICNESINKCFEKLPMNSIPDIYLWLGAHCFPFENTIINGKPAIIISLEYFSNKTLDSESSEARYYTVRIKEIEESIPAIIANQYAILILKQMNVIKDVFYSKLFEVGFTTFFSRWVFPQIVLSKHLFITSSELEWCCKNEWFLKREIKPYIKSEDKNVIEKYFSVTPTNSKNLFPNRIGCFTGYRIIEELLKKEHTLTLKDLITESQKNLVEKSGFFDY